MNKGEKLVIARGIFTTIIIVLFGLIIVNEKKTTILLPKITEKINTYIEENYKDITDEISIGDIVYEAPKYSVKLTSKKNENYSFYVEYKNKEITDSYKEDYLEGKSFLNKIKENLKEEVKNETNEECDIEIIATLDQYTSQVRERIINEDNLKELKFYTINLQLDIDNWNEKEITKIISNKIEIFSKNNYTPKYYKITINNKKDITQSIEIDNVTNDFLLNKYKEQIIKDILTDTETPLLKQSKITYKYLN